MTTALMVLLLMYLMLPPSSMILVVRIPISITLPLHPSTTMMSPTLYSPSKTMNIPAMISAIKDWAPRPMISPKIPALTSNVWVSTPQEERIRMIAMMNSAYLVKLMISLRAVWKWVSALILSLMKLRTTNSANATNSISHVFISEGMW